MKKNLIISLFAVVVSAGFSLAAEGIAVSTVPSTAAPAAKAAKPAAAAQVCEGTIGSIGNEMIIVNAAAGKNDSLAVESTTVVKKDGKAAKIDELTIGSSVKVAYKKKAGKLIATKIMEKAPAVIKY